MNQGTPYIDAGDALGDYWASSYVQTLGIDFVGDHASITPIGSFSRYFTGEYEGGLFQIKHRSYGETTELKHVGDFAKAHLTNKFASVACGRSRKLGTGWFLPDMPRVLVYISGRGR